MGVATYVVTVSSTEPPLFPVWCPVCGADCPEHLLTVRAVAWHATAKNLRSIWPFCWIRVPGCADCDARLRWLVYRRRFGFVVCLVAGWLVLNDMIAWENGRERRQLAPLVGLLATLPALLYEVYHPRPVNLAILPEGLVFGFVNRDYAEEFAYLNRAEVTVVD